MPFNLDHCIDAVADSLELTEGVGIIHTRRRLIRDEQSARAVLFDEDSGLINGWMVTPAAAATSVTVRNPGMQTAIPIGGGGGNLTTYQVQIEAYFGIDDANASEVTFRNTCERVVARLNAIGKLTAEMTFQLPADIETFGYTMFGGVFLLHSATIRAGFQGRVAYDGS